MSLKIFFQELGLIFSTTVGVGVFALPYIFKEAGWALSVFYLLIFSGLMVAVHIIYWRVLVKTGKTKRLLMLVRENFGSLGFGLGATTIIGGITLAMVAYLILGGHFLRLVFPGMAENLSIIVFWILVSLPLFFKLSRMIGLEVWAGLILAGAVIFLLLEAEPLSTPVQIQAFSSSNLFLPFGAVLFALAGWTAIEPIYDSSKKRLELTNFKTRIWQFSFATFGAALIYLIFVLAILGSSSSITTDTISGLQNLPGYELAILLVIGIFAIATSYLPFGREFESLAIKDLKFSRLVSLVLVLAVPVGLVFLGLKNFSEVVGLVGGVFLALQYFFIVLVGRKVLEIRGFLKKLGFYSAAAIFLLGAVYEVYYFVIR